LTQALEFKREASYVSGRWIGVDSGKGFAAYTRQRLAVIVSGSGNVVHVSL
jgi:hypothetical protein